MILSFYNYGAVKTIPLKSIHQTLVPFAQMNYVILDWGKPALNPLDNQPQFLQGVFL